MARQDENKMVHWAWGAGRTVNMCQSNCQWVRTLQQRRLDQGDGFKLEGVGDEVSARQKGHQELRFQKAYWRSTTRDKLHIHELRPSSVSLMTKFRIWLLKIGSRLTCF